jgi:hypothetical protein
MVFAYDMAYKLDRQREEPASVKRLSLSLDNKTLSIGSG